MKNIDIPEPCSEDWNEMTPNEKGAFCQKCALDVYDFTDKSADEIRKILRVNISSPVCMRIEPKQLEKLNSDFFSWKMDNKHSYQRAWVFTLLVVFGMTLFSCEEDEKPVVEKFQKVGQTILNEKEEGNVIDQIEPVDLEMINNHSEPVDQLDKVKVIEQKDILSVEDSFIQLTESNPQVIDEVVVVGNVVRLREEYTLGGVPMISPDYNDYLLVTTPVYLADSMILHVEPKITGLVYPNPASNQTTLQVNMPKGSKGEIELFALNGQKIKTIHSGRIKKGESEFSIDLTDLETGLYLVVVSSGKLKETIKFSKI